MRSKNSAEELDEKSIIEPDFPAWYQASTTDTEKILALLQERKLPGSILDEIIEMAFTQIASAFSGYEKRNEQLEMSKQILRSLYLGRSAVIEAGTGVGKSFAYLVAATAYSYLTGESVFIATETKNLQMQLYEKDILFIKKHLQQDLSFEMCLGSSNYLCKIRYEESFQTGAFMDVISTDDIEYFHDWAKSALNGKIQGNQFELTRPLSSHFWQTVNRDSESCIASKCGSYGNCNYYRMRKIWQNSRILIGNHHLFLYNILNDKKPLPPFDAVILDEAHGFIKTGYNIFTQGFSRNIIEDKWKIFERVVKNAGSLPLEKKEDLITPWQNLNKSWLMFFSQWEVELDMNFMEGGLKTVEKKTKIDSSEIISSASDIIQQLGNLLEEETDSLLLSNWQSTKKFCDTIIQFASAFKNMDFNRYVYWAEKRNNLMYLFCCNLLLGEILNENMQEAVIYTSATIGYWPKQQPPSSVATLIEQGYFSTFIKEAVPSQITTNKQLDMQVQFSSFPYQKNCGLYIPADLEIPAWGSTEASNWAYEKKLTNEIVKLVQLSKGGALILFTSKALLERIHEQLIDQLDFEIYSQLVDGANAALEKFRQNENGVLLGTNSFWQGVDIAGYGLRLLVITKLMFTPPDDPIFQARSQMLEAKGQKPFFELALPSASQMLRQAFGRLIRSEKDKGVVAILDNRILHKSYGKILLANLPAVQISTSFEKLHDVVKSRNLFSR